MSGATGTDPAGITEVPVGSMRRRLLRNIAWLSSSQAAAAGMGIGALALTAQTLGPAGLGILAVIEAWARLLARLLHPEPWQALIQFGTAALEDGDRLRFRRLVWMSLVADMMLGLLVAITGVTLALLAGRWLGMEEGRAGLFALAAAASGLALRPTATGVLRIFDRFDRLARIDVAIASLRLSLVAVAWQAGASIEAFVWLFVVWTIADGIWPMLAAWSELRRRDLLPLRCGLQTLRLENPGVLRLFVTTNINVTLRQLRQRLDVLFLAPLLTPATLGFYQIGRRIADASLRLGRPLGQVVLPEFSRMAARGNLAGLRRALLIGSAGMLLVLAAPLSLAALYMRPLITTLFGADFAPASTSVTIMLGAAALQIAGLTLAPALISLHRDAALAWLTGLTTVLFFVALGPAVYLGGIEGAATMHLLVNGAWLVGCLWTGLRATRTPKAAP